MKKILPYTLLLLMVPMLMGCPKKIIEQKKEDLLVNLITTNIWLMRDFSEGSTVLTADFAPYEFKFNTDGSVWGMKTGAANAVGTWAGSTSTMTITSNFPTETGILKKLNGVWNITNTTPSEVWASRTESGVELKLHLVKK